MRGSATRAGRRKETSERWRGDVALDLVLDWSLGLTLADGLIVMLLPKLTQHKGGGKRASHTYCFLDLLVSPSGKVEEPQQSALIVSRTFNALSDIRSLSRAKFV